MILQKYKPEEITKELFNKLNEEYPYASETRTKYLRKMDYIVYPVDFLDSVQIKRMIRAKGFGPVILLQFLRQKMGKTEDAFFITTTGDEYQFLIEEATYVLGQDVITVNSYIQALVDEKLIVFLEVDGGEQICTTPDQIFNFELLNSKRKSSRESSQAYIVKKNKEKEAQENGQEAS